VLAAAIVFGVTMAGISTYELVSGHNLSGGHSTTVGDVSTSDGTSVSDSGGADASDDSGTSSDSGSYGDRDTSTNSPSGTGTPEGGVASPSPEEGGGTARAPHRRPQASSEGSEAPGNTAPSAPPRPNAVQLGRGCGCQGPFVSMAMLMVAL
jgi:hypothetical protein